MPNFNRVILAGNMTRDPQVSVLPTNTTVCECGLAINRKWKSQNGELREETTFVDLRAFGKTADTIGKYFAKGKPIMVEGRLKYDQWEAKDGGKRSKLYVVVDSFQFVDAGGNREGGRSGRGDEQADEMPPINADDEHPDDIPF